MGPGPGPGVGVDGTATWGRDPGLRATWQATPHLSHSPAPERSGTCRRGGRGRAGRGFPTAGRWASPQTALGCTCTKNSPPGVQRHPKAFLTAALSSVTPGYAPRTPVIVPWGPRPWAAEPATVWPRPPSHTRCVLVPPCHGAPPTPRGAPPGETPAAPPCSRRVPPCSAPVLRPALASHGQSGAPREGTRT